MRNFINIINETEDSYIESFFKAVGSHFESQGQYFHDGACLDFAQAMRKVLAHHGVESELAFMMRSPVEDDIDDDEVLSHVVVEVNGETFDSQGSQAFEQWETQFNYNQRMNGDEEAEFSFVSPDGNVEAAALELGVPSNPSLRQAIEAYALSLPTL